MMPFAYYGAKHGLAAKYPPPAYRTIVEPFAGSAGYAVHHAARIDRVILIDADAALVALWHELQRMTPVDVDRIGAQLEQSRFDHPLLAGMAGGTTISAVLAGKNRHGSGVGSVARTEVIWRNDAEQHDLFAFVGSESPGTDQGGAS